MTDGKLSGNDADEKKEEAVSGKEDKKNFDASETADVREKEEVIDTAKADLKIEDVKPIKQGGWSLRGKSGIRRLRRRLQI